MTLSDLKNLIMFQTNNDTTDVSEYLPYLTGYINKGYDILYYELTQKHLDDDEAAESLSADTDEPELEDWLHPSLADYATWMIYRNGNIAKQQRGQAYLEAFETTKQTMLNRLNRGKQFTNHLRW